MSLLKFPGMLEGWLTRLLPLGRKAAKTVKPVVEKTIRTPMPDDSIFDDIENIYDQVDELCRLLQRKEEVSIRIVTTPEKIGNQYRSFVLPPKLTGKAVTGAEYADGKLQVVLA